MVAAEVGCLDDVRRHQADMGIVCSRVNICLDSVAGAPDLNCKIHHRLKCVVVRGE